MKVPTHAGSRSTIPGIAALLCYLLLVNQFAQAQPFAQSSTPAERQAPAAASMSEATAQSRLLAARNLAIVDDGADDHFSGGSTAEAGHALAASLRAWGRYNIVSNPRDADLVLQLHGTVTRSYTAGADDSYGSYVYNPHFRLTIADPATLDPLWVINVPILLGTRKKDRADLFNVSAGNLTSQLKLLTATPLTATETADLREPAIRRHRRNALIIGVVAASIGASVGISLAIKHSMDRNQEAFCAAHGITPCPS